MKADLRRIQNNNVFISLLRFVSLISLCSYKLKANFFVLLNTKQFSVAIDIGWTVHSVYNKTFTKDGLSYV